MGFKKTFGGLILLMLFLIPMVMALDTPIKIQTAPNLEVTIRVLNMDSSINPRTLEGGAFVDKPSGEDGIVEVVFSSDAVNSNKFDISIMRRKNGALQKYQDGSSVREINNNGEHMKSGWPVEIDATVDPPVLVKSGNPKGVEETTNEGSTGNELDVVVEVEEDEPVVDENTEEIDAEISSGITGKAITGIKDVATSKITYYILGAIILILVIIIILKKKLLKKILPKKKGSIEFGVKKEDKNDDKEESMSTREELEDAEKKLDEARKELEDVKGKDEKEEKIRQIKARFDRDKAALEELEKEWELIILKNIIKGFINLNSLKKIWKKG